VRETKNVVKLDFFLSYMSLQAQNLALPNRAMVLLK